MFFIITGRTGGATDGKSQLVGHYFQKMTNHRGLSGSGGCGDDDDLLID
jgi:hypothetical protein